MQIGSPQVLNYIIDALGNLYRLKVLEIGNWNMDSSISVGVVHGLTAANIRQITVVIRADSDVNDGNQCFDLNMGNAITGVNEGFWNLSGGSSEGVTLNRRNGGAFDSVSFNESPRNRGWVFVWYVDA